MDKYGVEFDTDKVKTAEEGEEKKGKCPECDKDLADGGVCPEHGTEPLEKRER